MLDNTGAAPQPVTEYNDVATRGAQQPTRFPIVFEARQGYVLIRPGNALTDPIDSTWPRPS